MLPVIIISLIVLVLEKEVTIENKTMFNDNIEINYPFFCIEEIDLFIEDYLNKNIEKNNQVLIDYDYMEKDNNYYVTFYKNIINSNKISNDMDTFIIDIKENKITRTSPVSYEYDIVHNKLVDKDKKMIALTFDDGPNYNTNKVLNVLEEYQIPATFFVLGSKIKGNEQILNWILTAGSEIGNHTYNHKILTRLEEDKIKEEIESTSNKIFEVTGEYPTLLRPSYGIVNKKVRK